MIVAEEPLKLPHLDYAALAPMLILFGVACLGVVVEAALPRGQRHRVQLPLALAGLAAALLIIVKLAGSSSLTAAGAIAMDSPALFLQGAIVVLGAVALLLIGERTLEPGGPFVAQAAVTANTDVDWAQASRSERATEVYPLALFGLSGMMLY